MWAQAFALPVFFRNRQVWKGSSRPFNTVYSIEKSWKLRNFAQAAVALQTKYVGKWKSGNETLQPPFTKLKSIWLKTNGPRKDTWTIAMHL